MNHYVFVNEIKKLNLILKKRTFSMGKMQVHLHSDNLQTGIHVISSGGNPLWSRIKKISVLSFSFSFETKEGLV